MAKNAVTFLSTRKTGTLHLSLLVFAIMLAIPISFAKCVTKTIYYSNVVTEITASVTFVHELSKCLNEKCENKFGSKYCSQQSTITIPGFDPSWKLHRNMTEEQRLADSTKRLFIHEIHLSEVSKYFEKTTTQPCGKQFKRIRNKTRGVRKILNRLQKCLGLSTAIQMNKPPTLASTVAKTEKDWYKVTMTMLRKLKQDFANMKNTFSRST